MRRHIAIIPATLISVATLVASGPPAGDTRPYTTDFGIEFSRDLQATGGNQYLPLRPGAYSRLAGMDDGEWHELEVIVTNDVVDVNFHVSGHRVHAEARVVEERVWIDGELEEITEQYFTWCPLTGNVYMLGESTNIMARPGVMEESDRWLVGEGDVEAGLAMPSFVLLGARYFTENAPDHSMSRSEVLQMGFTQRTEAGPFTNCILISETSPDEPEEGETLKTYAPGVGIITDGPLVLVEHH